MQKGDKKVWTKLELVWYLWEKLDSMQRKTSLPTINEQTRNQIEWEKLSGRQKV